MLISLDTYLFSIIVLEIAVVVAAIIMRNKSSILRENLRFYMDGVPLILYVTIYINHSKI